MKAANKKHNEKYREQENKKTTIVHSECRK